jgi:phage N-6-adenine-methyltransferase
MTDALGPDRINRGMFTSQTDEWATPESFMAVIRQRWPRFDLDACALAVSTKAERFYSPEDDGLAQPWDADLIWMNPPYGRSIGKWVDRARLASKDGATVVCLLPVRCDTAWWHRNVQHADEVSMIRGRLHFGGGHERTAHNAPFPSAVVVFSPAGGPPILSWMERA